MFQIWVNDLVIRYAVKEILLAKYLVSGESRGERGIYNKNLNVNFKENSKIYGISDLSFLAVGKSYDSQVCRSVHVCKLVCHWFDLFSESDLKIE